MTTLIIVIIGLALVFDYINGFHDAANSIATIVSTKVLTPFQAVIWAALFNFAAYFIFKDHGVANTVAKTVRPEVVSGQTGLIVVLSGLIAAVIWNLFTWWFGIPSSSSHTLIGGFAGAAVSFGGFGAINSDPIIRTAIFIIVAPLVGMLIAFLISLWFLLSFRRDALPRIVSLLVIACVALLLYSSLELNPVVLAKGTHFKGYFWQVFFYTKNFKWILLALILTIFAVFTFWLNTLNAHKSNIWFKRLQLLSSAPFSIGHGGNDAQNVMGIIMAALVGSDPSKYSLDHMVWWVPLACYTAMGLGTMS